MGRTFPLNFALLLGRDISVSNLNRELECVSEQTFKERAQAARRLRVNCVALKLARAVSQRQK